MAILRATIRGSIFGQTHINVLHFQRDSYVSADRLILAQELRDNWLQYVKAITPFELVWNNIHVQNISTPAEAHVDLAISVAGSSSSTDGVPCFVTFCFRVRTAIAGKRGRGRFYLSSPNHGHIVAGVFTSALLTAAATVCTNIMTRYGPSATSNFGFGVCPRNDASSFKGVTSMDVDSVPRVQRRRNIGVGI